MGRDIFYKLLKPPSNLTLNNFMDGESTTSLGNFCGQPASHQPHVQKVLPFIQFKSTFLEFKTIAPCPTATGLGKKSFSIFLISPL